MSEAEQRPIVGVVMGVAGVGKTAVGRLAAERLGWDFVDGDDYHPDGNVEKMSRGIPLTDEDRRGWLESLRDLIHRRIASGRRTIVTCSALKESYRQAILEDNDKVAIIYLKAPADVVRDRIQSRSGHFFDASLLASQYATLEEPNRGAIIIDATRPIEEVVDSVVRRVTST